MQKSSIANDRLYFTDDNGKNYYSCKIYNDVSNCNLCEEKKTCSECKTNHVLVNQSTACVLQQDIDNHLLFHDMILDIYIPCKDLISECNSCSDRTNCTECLDGSVLEQNNSCINITLVKNSYYILDNESNKYISCSIIENCVTCSSRTVCTKCEEGFRVNNNICQKIVPNNDDKQGLSTGEIVGIVFGCVGFLLIVSGVVYFLIKKFKKNNDNPNITNYNLPKNEEDGKNIYMKQYDGMEGKQDSSDSGKRNIRNVSVKIN